MPFFGRSILAGSRGPTRTASTATLWSTSGTFSYDPVAGKFDNAYTWNTSASTQNGFYITTPTTIGGSGKPGTVEFWIRITTLDQSQTYFQWGTQSVRSYALAAGTDDFRVNSGFGSVTFSTINVDDGDFAINTYHHMAFTNAGSNDDWTWYLNGTSRGTFADNNQDTWAFGKGTSTGGGTHGLRIDEIRVSKIRRYTANFTPSSSAFSNDSDTLALFHCETDPAEDDIN
jgi:hypothetical protein